MFGRSNDERHLYFTFRRFIPDDFKVTKGHGWDQIDLGSNNCKIDDDYTGNPEDQIHSISIRIIEEEDDNFTYFETLMLSEVFSCFRVNEMPGVKPSDLPQMLFLGANCKFAAKSENLNSIVCLDHNAALYSPKIPPTPETVLRLKGNTFINDSAFIAINHHPEGKNYLGKNTIFGSDCYVSSSVIEDNVYIGSYCNLDVDTKVGFNSFIRDYVKISEYQSIPAYQDLTTKVPASLNLFKDQRGFLLKDFDRLTKRKD